MITVYLYTDIPGAGKNWTLAVYAISRKDADNYIKYYNKGGRFIRSISSGAIDAHCGAVTEKARLESGVS